MRGSNRQPAAERACVCMVAYDNYFNNARVKNYVDALLDAGYDVDVYALGASGDTRPGLRVVSLMDKVTSPRALPYLLSQLAFLVRALVAVSLACARRRYAVVHVHNMPDFIVFSALFAKLMGARVILDVQDTMPEAYATKVGLPLGHPFIAVIRLEERLSAAFADAVITTHDLHREAIVGHGIRRDKIAIVMNVGNPAIFRPRPPRPATRDGLLLGYHGTIAERLGVDLVLEAIHRLRASCPGLRFLLLGDGEFMPTVRRLVGTYGLESAVTLGGWIPVEQLPQALAAVDVGIVGNRRYTELRQNWMLPVKMLEYAAMEIPTIAPRLKVITRYFDDHSAILYEPDNVDDMARAIKAVYDRPAVLEEVRGSLRAFNAHYNWPTMGAAYVELVRRLTRRRGP